MPLGTRDFTTISRPAQRLRRVGGHHHLAGDQNSRTASTARPLPPCRLSTKHCEHWPPSSRSARWSSSAKLASPARSRPGRRRGRRWRLRSSSASPRPHRAMTRRPEGALCQSLLAGEPGGDHRLPRGPRPCIRMLLSHEVNPTWSLRQALGQADLHSPDDTPQWTVPEPPRRTYLAGSGT